MKAEANGLFAQAHWKEAITTYDRALATCPNYLDYEIAVLKSNVAACYVKLEDWKEAVQAASAALDGLDRLQGRSDEGKKRGGGKEEGEEKHEGKTEDGDRDGDGDADAEEEIVNAGATRAEDTSATGKREADVERIRGKALMRRARARSELGTWSSLQGAEEGESLLVWS